MKQIITFHFNNGHSKKFIVDEDNNYNQMLIHDLRYDKFTQIEAYERKPEESIFFIIIKSNILYVEIRDWETHLKELEDRIENPKF